MVKLCTIPKNTGTIKMFYTVGRKEVFDKGIAASEVEGTTYFAEGRGPQSLGALVFVTFEDAITHLDRTGKLESHHVYGLETTADNLHRPIDEDHYHLIAGCPVIKLPEPDPA